MRNIRDFAAKLLSYIAYFVANWAAGKYLKPERAPGVTALPLGRFLHGLSAYFPITQIVNIRMGDSTLKTLKMALLGATFLIGAAGAANAADLGRGGGSYKDGPGEYMPPITWAGFYAGIHAGTTFDDTFELSSGNFSISGEADSAFIGGIHVGYNWQKSANWVFGIEAAVDLLDDEDVTDYLGSIRGRLGYAMGNSLFYGTAGVAFLGYSDEVSGILDDDTAVGFVVGGGLEHKLSNNLSIGVESLYYSFSSDTVAPSVELDRDFWTVQARLSYHFNRGYDEPLK